MAIAVSAKGLAEYAYTLIHIRVFLFGLYRFISFSRRIFAS